MFIVYFVCASLSPRFKSMCDVLCATCHVRGSKPLGGLGSQGARQRFLWFECRIPAQKLRNCQLVYRSLFLPAQDPDPLNPTGVFIAYYRL
jgi:hypothetical protein